MVTSTLYHAALRTAALTLALVLLFDSGIISPLTQQLSLQSQQYVATAIGMYASVESTPLNETTAALTAKEQELNDREAALQQREINVSLNRDSSGAVASNLSTYLMSILLFVLLVLIIINYILDFTRARTPTPRPV